MSAAGTDLNLLVVLRALLDEANVTRAGERLGMSQSSTSAALSRLRAKFDDELLIRVGREYELTPLARLLVPRLHRAIPLIEQALSGGPSTDETGSRREFALMMSDYAGVQLQPALATILRESPGISLSIVPLPEHPMDSERDLIAHDLVFAVPGIGIEGSSVELFVDDYVCLVDRNNPVAASGELTWEQFCSMPRAASSFGHDHMTPADRRLHELGYRSRPRVTTASFLPLPTVIAGTDLVGLIPRRLATQVAEATGTVALEAPFDRVEIIETMWWHPSYDTDPAHAWLRERFVAAYKTAG